MNKKVLHGQGKSQVGIAKIVKYSRYAVQSAIKRFVETGLNANKIRSGRKCITTKRQNRKLIFESLKNCKDNPLRSLLLCPRKSKRLLVLEQ